MTAGPRDRSATDPTRVVFFGSGAFAVPTLEALLARSDVLVAGVVTVPDRPAGRGGRMTATPVALTARERGVPLLQPARLRDAGTVAAIAELGPDIGVLADFGRIVPPPLLALPVHGFLNVHPSLLPRHRGAAPIAGAILAGDAETGVTVMAMDAGLDTGPVVATERWPLDGRETAESLEARAAVEGAALLDRILVPWLAGTVHAIPQLESAATLTRPLVREDGRLDGHEPAAVAERRTRAFRPWPGTFVELRPGERLLVLEASVAPAVPGDRPETLVPDGSGDRQGVALVTSDGRLRLERVRPAGGREMTGAAWLRGRPSAIDGRPVLAAPGEAPA